MLHLFHLYGILQDIVSDRGPQFASQVWKALCQALETLASLYSSYHTQTNSQTERANQDIGGIPTVCGFSSPNILVHTPALGWICLQLPGQHCLLSPRVINLLYFQARSLKLQSPQSRPIYAVPAESSSDSEPMISGWTSDPCSWLPGWARGLALITWPPSSDWFRQARSHTQKSLTVVYLKKLWQQSDT